MSNLHWLWRARLTLPCEPAVASRPQQWTRPSRPCARLCTVAASATATLGPPRHLPPEERHGNPEQACSGTSPAVLHHKKQGTELHR